MAASNEIAILLLADSTSSESLATNCLYHDDLFFELFEIVYSRRRVSRLILSSMKGVGGCLV